MSGLVIWKDFLEQEEADYIDEYLRQHLGYEGYIDLGRLANNWMHDNGFSACSVRVNRGEVRVGPPAAWARWSR